MSEDTTIKGLLIFKLSVGFMPKAKAESHLKQQASSLKSLSDKLKSQGIETIYLPTQGESILEYISFDGDYKYGKKLRKKLSKKVDRLIGLAKTLVDTDSK